MVVGLLRMTIKRKKCLECKGDWPRQFSLFIEPSVYDWNDWFTEIERNLHIPHNGTLIDAEAQHVSAFTSNISVSQLFHSTPGTWKCGEYSRKTTWLLKYHHIRISVKGKILSQPDAMIVEQELSSKM